MQIDGAYNLVDILIVATLSIGFILGIWKGFVRSLTALASLVLGIGLAVRYHSLVEPYLARISALEPHISMILAMVIIFFAVQVVFVVIRRILDALVDVTRLGWLDRVLGAAMGVAAGFLMVAALVQGLLIGVPDWELVKKSKLVQPVDDLTQKAVQYVPEEARKAFDESVAKWKKGRTAKPSTPQGSKEGSKKEPVSR
jgi:membrane protein required for colicin V production